MIVKHQGYERSIPKATNVRSTDRVEKPARIEVAKLRFRRCYWSRGLPIISVARHLNLIVAVGRDSCSGELWRERCLAK